VRRVPEHERSATHFSLMRRKSAGGDYVPAFADSGLQRCESYPSWSTTGRWCEKHSCNFLRVLLPGRFMLAIHRQSESEARSAARIIFCPDTSTVSFHDRSDN
jgi:hypothetical protein